MSIIINGYERKTLVHTLSELICPDGRLDMAVSYVRESGWDVLSAMFTRTGLRQDRCRLLMTDQMWVTQPSALRRPLAAGAGLWRYVGNRVYHPKVFIVSDRAGEPKAAIVGSGNLSSSGLREGIEAGVVVTEHAALRSLRSWFESLLADGDDVIRLDETQLAGWQTAWEEAKRAEVRHALRHARPTRPPRPIRPAPAAPSPAGGAASEAVEDVFFQLASPIAVLGIDHAGNNVRTLRFLLEVIQKPAASIVGKQRSELNLLGLMHRGALTATGGAAARSRSEAELARIWCDWVHRTAKPALVAINPSIASFKDAAARFWRLRPDVRTFFLENCANDRRKQRVQPIELLCNTSDLACEISMEGLPSVVTVITNRLLPPAKQNEVQEYLDNKGNRSWSTGDRRTMLEAWHTVAS